MLRVFELLSTPRMELLAFEKKKGELEYGRLKNKPQGE